MELLPLCEAASGAPQGGFTSLEGGCKPPVHKVRSERSGEATARSGAARAAVRQGKRLPCALPAHRGSPPAYGVCAGGPGSGPAHTKPRRHTARVPAEAGPRPRRSGADPIRGTRATGRRLEHSRGRQRRMVVSAHCRRPRAVVLLLPVFQGSGRYPVVPGFVKPLPSHREHPAATGLPTPGVSGAHGHGRPRAGSARVSRADALTRPGPGRSGVRHRRRVRARAGPASVSAVAVFPPGGRCVGGRPRSRASACRPPPTALPQACREYCRPAGTRGGAPGAGPFRSRGHRP